MPSEFKQSGKALCARILAAGLVVAAVGIDGTALLSAAPLLVGGAALISLPKIVVMAFAAKACLLMAHSVLSGVPRPVPDPTQTGPSGKTLG